MYHFFKAPHFNRYWAPGISHASRQKYLFLFVHNLAIKCLKNKDTKDIAYTSVKIRDGVLQVFIKRVRAGSKNKCVTQIYLKTKFNKVFGRVIETLTMVTEDRGRISLIDGITIEM